MMKLALILVLVASPIPAAAQDLRVPFELKSDQIFVQAKMNGHAAVLKFDPGATACVFYKFEPPQSAGMASIEVRTAAGIVKGSRGFAHLEIGNYAFNIQAAYLHTDSLTEDGLIGLDLLRKFKRVTIDFEAKEIEFVPFH